MGTERNSGTNKGTVCSICKSSRQAHIKIRQSRDYISRDLRVMKSDFADTARKYGEVEINNMRNERAQ